MYTITERLKNAEREHGMVIMEINRLRRKKLQLEHTIEELKRHK